MTAAVITASASVLVAVLGFLLNRRNQHQLQRRQALLTRVNHQLRDLYGPLHALVDVNERIWQALHESFLPPHDKRIPSELLTKEALQTWAPWLNHALMPANLKMRDLIVENADLIIEPEMPGPLLAFCAHVAAYEVLLSTNTTPHGPDKKALISHPGQPYTDYVRQSFMVLKREQARLLTLTNPT